MENKKNLHIYAGICFVIAAICSVINTFQGGFYFGNLIGDIGYLLIAVGMFISNPIASAVGCAIAAGTSVEAVFYYLKQFIIYLKYDVLYMHTSVTFNTVIVVSNFLFLVFLFIALLIRRNSKPLCFVAAGFLSLNVLCILLRNLYLGGTVSFSISVFLPRILKIAGTILAGYAVVGFPTKASKASPAISSGVYSKIERLEKIKVLLDNGAISQEEFEEKKRNILE